MRTFLNEEDLKLAQICNSTLKVTTTLITTSIHEYVFVCRAYLCQDMSEKSTTSSLNILSHVLALGSYNQFTSNELVMNLHTTIRTTVVVPRSYPEQIFCRYIFLIDACDSFTTTRCHQQSEKQMLRRSQLRQTQM
ncbi:unnamed protein product [Amoebophrya sp. A25]|nr:unnamed protein product [Amoebophrya sp. A25]|eukprot:GSA25T00003094001.1